MCNQRSSVSMMHFVVANLLPQFHGTILGCNILNLELTDALPFDQSFPHLFSRLPFKLQSTSNRSHLYVILIGYVREISTTLVCFLLRLQQRCFLLFNNVLKNFSPTSTLVVLSAILFLTSYYSLKCDVITSQYTINFFNQ